MPLPAVFILEKAVDHNEHGEQREAARGKYPRGAVLVAVGVTASGHHRVLGVALSEAETHWRAFLDSLIERCLRGVKFIASDNHGGLKAARKALFAVAALSWPNKMRSG